MTGLASLLGYKTGANPLLDFLHNNSSTLLGLGAGIAGGGPDFGRALGSGLQLAGEGRTADFNKTEKLKADTTLANNENQTKAWLAKHFPDYGDLPTDQAWDLAMKSMTPAQDADPSATYQGRLDIGKQQGLSGADLTTYALTGKLAGGNQTARAGVGQPIPFRNKKTGELVGAQPMTVGPAVNTITGQPFDNPDDWAYDPAGLAADKTNATVDAKTQAAARAALPGAQQAFDIANKAADALLGDTAGMADQFGNTLGFPNQMFPMARPGSDMARFRTELEQGQGNAFLQARQVLKGAGQVTDYEGAKAEAAYSRMALAAKNNNQEEFVSAVQDFKQAVAEGYAKLQAAAQGDYAKNGPGITSTGGPGPSGRVLTYNPATGELE